MGISSLQTSRDPSSVLPKGHQLVHIQSLQPDAAARWDRFVLGHPRATFFHLTGWMRVMEKTFGYQPYCFYAQRDGEITGVAPVFLVANWMVGRCLISTPLAVYGGICAADDESGRLLLHHLKQLAVELKVDHFELRNREGGLLPEFHPNLRYTSFSSSLAKDPEEQWKALPKDTRYMVRRARKAGLQARPGLDQMRQFYRLFSISMRRLGTPVFPRALFENLAQEFSDSMDLLLVYSGAQPLAGILSFHFRDEVLPYYAGGSPAARRLAGNDFMYWELMERSALAGFRRFDFGRSRKGTGAYAFKTRWNMEVRTLDYQYYLVGRKTAPNFSPANPKFELATRIWKQLPLSLTTWVGPHVVRWFP